MPRTVRAVAAQVVVAAYVFPLAVGTLSNLGHGVHHLLEEVVEQNRRAVALGHVRGDSGFAPARDDPPSRASAPSASDAFVHAHGGDAHSHGGSVAALLVASGHADEQLNEAEGPVQGLSTHVPTSRPVVVIIPASIRLLAEIQTSMDLRHGPSPPLPPPRA